ncbi:MULTISPECIES: LysR family transcriptional regulator [Paraburkholderia]|uniref:LysR substrate-binding domain-containing protein n=1 Tax=Paraburkholderia TaxID=1822464 RepID=UPI00225B7B16|nr:MULTISPECIES: LysR family transcriptional regulator [Paraburkholderia]MCX4163658.1 LysR substrate-binding domain-containing protein [Paraburkholderia megapolitana]MDN7159153.1 LysR substrate-binding domain-containing protein [Paraburkholderia sp. CHISQ3]MDQ6496200.1 LysR substrate-binding domain-containing protein [Paraburkholderia megapolitana]
MDHLQAIRIFTRVVETGGFGRAALSLKMPNATVSKWIKSLEMHLGVKLLERSTRSVSVTTDGAAYYERTRHLLSELDDIEATLGRAQANPRGALRVDMGGSTASGILVPALPAFRERYPDIQVQLSVTDRTVDLIAENIDCAIRSTADDPGLVTRRIGTLAWTTCASPAYLAKYGTPKHPREIVDKSMPVVGYFSASSGLTQPLRFGRGDEVLTLERVRHDVLVSESNTHLATALAGLGIVHTLDFMARPSIKQKTLVPILAKWRPEPLEVYVVYPPSRRYSTKVRVFVDWVAALFGSM